jgi:hypothetical protein
MFAHPICFIGEKYGLQGQYFFKRDEK